MAGRELAYRRFPVHPIRDAHSQLSQAAQLHLLLSATTEVVDVESVLTRRYSLANLNSDMIIGAVKLDYLPTPERSLHGTMPFNPSQGLGQNEPKLWRVVRGLPFLGIEVAAFYFMWGVCLPPMLERIGEIMENGVHNHIGEAVHVQILQKFYGVEFLDSRFRGLVACFASLQFVDLACSWQSLTFLTDAGILYSILLIESARRANVMTLSYA